jgi:hypothetical protein
MVFAVYAKLRKIDGPLRIWARMGANLVDGFTRRDRRESELPGGPLPRAATHW